MVVDHEYRILEKGMKISGHTVLRCKRLTERVVGETYASWIVLCETDDPGSYHKWVTWIAYANSTGFHAESGHYFPSSEWEQAVGSYDKRGGW